MASWKSIAWTIVICSVSFACTSSGSPAPGSGGSAHAGGSANRSGSGGESAGTGGVSAQGGAGAQDAAFDLADRGGTGGGTTGPDGGDRSQGGRTGITIDGGLGSGGTTPGLGGTAGASRPDGSSATGGTAAAGGSAGSTATGGNRGDGLCPPGITQTITVAKDGSGQFTSVQAAVNSIASTTTAHTRIDIKAGTYTEKVTIARTNVCLVGAGATTTILAYGDSNASVGSTSGSASVLVSGDDFSAANLGFQNTHGPGSQAVALRLTGDRQQFLNCRFVGYQDTLYNHGGIQYFKNCYVQGNTDYVFGGATALFENCEARSVQDGSAITAPNTDAGRSYGIVFIGGKLTAASGVSGVALGRPWGPDGFAAFINVDLGAHVLAAGFVAMSGNQPQNARFHEAGSTGAGANASKRPSYQLSASQAASYTRANILGAWTPSYSQ